MILSLLFTMLLVLPVHGADPCREWFENAKLKPGPDCAASCGALPTGTDTSLCTLECSRFCRGKSVEEKVLGRVLYYPGLNSVERGLVKEYPKEAIVVFLQKEKAESSAMRFFKRDAQDDESDAFRHFLWAGLLAKELGPDLAKKFLDAHEASGKPSDPSRAMDLANNRAGLLVAERLRREGKLTEDQLEKEALIAMKSQTLIVLKPKGGPK